MTSVNILPDDINIIDDEDEQEETDLTRFLPNNDNEGEDKPPLVTCISPPDKYFGVYAIFYFLGITTLLPWNFFINADKYWMYKFREVNITDSGVSEVQYFEDSEHQLFSEHGKTPFQASFFSYLAIASNVPSTITFMVNAVVAKYISANTRIYVSLAMTFVMFTLSTVLVEVNTDRWQEDFFIITLVSVVLMNSFASFFQCGLLCVVAKFPPQYTTATMSGQALGGIFAAVANLLSIFMAADQVKSAFIYFILGSVSILVSLILSILLRRTLFYKFHAGEKSGFRFLENYPAEAMLRPVIRTYTFASVYKKVWIEALAAMMIFVVTLAAFPTLVVLVVSQNVPSTWNDKYFVACTSFLIFAIGDYLGRILCGTLKWPKKNSLWTLLFSVLRIGFIPLILMCNLYPRPNNLLPIIFSHDIEFTFISFFFGMSNGYLANLVFMNAPQAVTRDEQENASSIVTMFLGIGLSIGVMLSYGILKIM